MAGRVQTNCPIALCCFEGPLIGASCLVRAIEPGRPVNRRLRI